jgi:hypothetical protein
MNVIIVFKSLLAWFDLSIDTNGLDAKERDPSVTVFDPRFDLAVLAGIDNSGRQWK